MEVLEYIFFTSLADAFMNDQTPETHTHHVFICFLDRIIYMVGLKTKSRIFDEKKIIPTTAAARKK